VPCAEWKVYCRPCNPYGAMNFRRYVTVTQNFRTPQTILFVKRISDYREKNPPEGVCGLHVHQMWNLEIFNLLGFWSTKCSPVTTTEMNMIRTKYLGRSVTNFNSRTSTCNVPVHWVTFVSTSLHKTISSNFFKYSEYTTITNCSTMKQNEWVPTHRKLEQQRTLCSPQPFSNLGT
jgi:hypothetical protein